MSRADASGIRQQGDRGMKFGCGCFFFVSGLVGLFTCIASLLFLGSDISEFKDDFVVIGVCLLLGWILLKSFMSEQPDPSQQRQEQQLEQQQQQQEQEQTFIDARQTSTSLYQTFTTVRQIIDHASGGSGQTAVPDEPVTVECPGCGAPVAVSPSKSGECEYCGTMVRYSGTSGKS